METKTAFWICFAGVWLCALRGPAVAAGQQKKLAATRRFAYQITPKANWQNVASLPEPVRKTMRDIAAAARRRGSLVLFAGPSRSEKRMAAEVIAKDMGSSLAVVDLSCVAGKPLDRTVKKIARLLDAAEGAKAVLLFEESDALFGRRTQTRDDHDRYDNIPTAYLLQRMEDHRGLVILATNQRDQLDPTLLRRFRFAVGFKPADPPVRPKKGVRKKRE